MGHRRRRRTPVLNRSSSHPIKLFIHPAVYPPRAPKLKEAEIRKPKPKQNPLKAADVTVIDYKDVALLRKFISDRGKIRARRVTGVTVQEQRKIAQAIKNAREVALLPYSGAGR